MTIHWAFSALSLLTVTAGFALEGLAPGQKMEMARELLKSLETKDPKPARYINSRRYIQHDLGVEDGPEGVKELISQLPGATKGRGKSLAVVNRQGIAAGLGRISHPLQLRCSFRQDDDYCDGQSTQC